jgi:hypothetical protein
LMHSISVTDFVFQEWKDGLLMYGDLLMYGGLLMYGSVVISK